MKKPDILFHFSDQQRADNCRCYSQPLNVTPNLDKIESEGKVFKESGHETTKAILKERREGFKHFRRADDLPEFKSYDYDGYVSDENDKKIEFKGYRANCMTDFALEFSDKYDGTKPLLLTVSQIESYQQNDTDNCEAPVGMKEKYQNCIRPHDLEFLGGNSKEEYRRYSGQCNALDRNLGRLTEKHKDMGQYENTVIIYVSDHGCHFKTRNTSLSGVSNSMFNRTS